MTDYIVPGAYAEERAPSVPGFRKPASLRGYLLGKFPSGTVDTPTRVDRSSFRTLFGDPLPGSAGYDAEHFLAQGPDALYVCRVQGTAASISLGEDCGTATARVDGTWANGAGTGAAPTAGVIVTVETGTVAETKKVTVSWACPKEDTVEVLTEVYDNLVASSDAPRYIQSYVNARSKLIQISGDPTALPANADFLLASGVEPTYTAGIAAMASVRGRLCVFDDSDTGAVHTAIQTAVNTRTGAYPAMTGDSSIYVAHAPQYSTVNAIIALAAGFADPLVRMSGTWKLLLDSAMNVTRAMRESPILAGIRCRINPQETWVNKPAYGIKGGERSLSIADIQSLIEGNVCTITLWPQDETRGYRPVGYRASDGELEQIRVFKHWVAATEIAMSAWAAGELQGEADPDPLRTALKAQSDAYWGARKAAGEIERFTSQCDSANNLPADIEQNIVTKDVEVKAKSPALFVKLRITAGPESSIAREVE